MSHASRHLKQKRRQRIGWALALALATSVAYPVGVGGPAAAAPAAATAAVMAAPAPLAHAGLKMTIRELKQRLTYAHVFPGKGPRLDAKTRAAVKRFQRKFGLAADGVPGPKTQKKLIAVTKRGYGIRPVCLTKAKAICVDKSLKLVRVLDHGVLVHSFDARFGRRGMETREGAFSVGRKGTDYDKDGTVSLAEAKRYVSKEVNGASMPLPLFFSGGQAVHYSPSFKGRGYGGVGSHGCVNTRNYALMKWLWTWAPVRTPVYVYRGAQQKGAKKS